MAKELILITAGYPYGNSETFLETEIVYLSRVFDTVKIIAVNPKSSIIREVPVNCELHSCTIDSSSLSNFSSLRYLFFGDVWTELSRIRKEYGLKLSRTIFKTILVSYKNARIISKVLKPHVDDGKYQVFYSYWSDDSAIGLSLLKRKENAIKTVARCHGWDVYFHVHNANYLPFRNLIGEQMSMIAPISVKGEQYITEKWCIGENTKKVHVRRLGVQKGEECSEHADSNCFSIVSCSNVIPLKRVHLIVEALGLIEDLDIRWTHFGDGNLLPETRELGELKLKDNISCDFKGRTSNGEVLAFYRQQKPSLFINVSTTEGIPVSIMEAMSFSTPVFATDVGGTSEIVNNENGLLLPPDLSPEYLSDQIRAFFQSLEEIKELKRRAAFDTWKFRYNSEANYAEYAQELLDLRTI